MIYLSQEKQAGIVRDLEAGIMTGSEIAFKYKTALSTIARYKTLIKRRKPLPHARNAKMIDVPTTAIVVRNGSKGPKWGRYQDQIFALRGQGFSAKEIGAQLKIPTYMASYYAAKYKKYRKSQSQIQQVNSPNQKGAMVENGINKNILLGVAWAETERFTGLLAERLTLDPGLLRSRLPELLGRSPFRR